MSQNLKDLPKVDIWETTVDYRELLKRYITHIIDSISGGSKGFMSKEDQDELGILKSEIILETYHLDNE